VIKYIIENQNITKDGYKKLAQELDKYIESLGYNILNRFVDENKIHYYIQTKEGLEELIVDKNLFENPHYKEALIIYNKLKELLKGKIKDRDLLADLKKVEDSAKKGAYIQRYKGLGEMNPEQLWETTMDPSTRRLLKVKIEDFESANKVFTLFMGDEVEPRRRYIEQHAKDVKYLDV
jgi:DNA gyrase subunit B